MRLTDRIHDANARSTRIPVLLLRVVLAMMAGGILMAVLVPYLHRRGIELQAWMAWGAIIAALAIALVPEIGRRLGRRQD